MDGEETVRIGTAAVFQGSSTMEAMPMHDLADAAMGASGEARLRAGPVEAAPTGLARCANADRQRS
jgi:hypothetical protein